MPTATVMQFERYGIPVIEGNSGFNARSCIRWSQNDVRGHVYPHNLEHPYNSGTYLTYDTWCSNMNAAGVNIIFVSFGGDNRPWGGKSYSFEPPPYGTYNLFGSFLDDDDLPAFRNGQTSATPPPGALWNTSNIKALFEACEAHDVHVWATLFDHREFRGGWSKHAWNSGNNYLSGVTCELADRGFIPNPYDIFTNATAIAAAKARIDYIYDLVGTTHVICAWELVEELTWMMTPDFWDRATGWDATQVDIVRNQITPWVVEMATYLRAKDEYNRPISNSVLRYPTHLADWPVDPDNIWNVQAEPMLVYPLDIPGINYFYGGDYDEAQLSYRKCKEKAGKKRVIVHQYWPFTTDTDPPADESSPYLISKKHQWMNICSGRWGVGSFRWAVLEEDARGIAIRGSYADPDFYQDIPGVAKTFRSYAGTRMLWTNASDWSGSVSTTNVDYINSWGDGDNLNLFINWQNVGAKTVTAQSVTNGSWTIRIFDWTDGTLNATQNILAAVNTFSFTVNSGDWSEYRMVAYCSKD